MSDQHLELSPIANATPRNWEQPCARCTTCIVPPMHRADMPDKVRRYQLELEHQSLEQLRRSTDRLFVGLQLVQLLVAALLALTTASVSGGDGAPAPDVSRIVGLLLGGAISSVTVFLALRFPGKTITRHTMAVAQTGWTIVYACLTGSFPEAHLFVMVSLAALTLYCDWRVFVSGTVPVLVFYVVGQAGRLDPMLPVRLPGLFYEHAPVAWILLLNIFLFARYSQSRRQIWERCGKQAELELTNKTLNYCLHQRTKELEKAVADYQAVSAKLQEETWMLADYKAKLAEETEGRRVAERARAELQQELARVSRDARMAEIVTGVLHNVGNIVNSINVSIEVLKQNNENSRAGNLKKVVEMLREHESDLEDFLHHDPRGQKVIEFLGKLSDRLVAEQQSVRNELYSLIDNLSYLKEIVNVQQSYAKMRGGRQKIEIPRLIDDAIKALGLDFAEKGIEVVRNYEPVPPLLLDAHKLLQIVTNLLTNAVDSVMEAKRDDRSIEISVRMVQDEVAAISVRDNGVGIAPDMISTLFQFGFTTKATGHGFGLHSCALMAKELGGSIKAESDGPGKGATFTLFVPIASREDSRESTGQTNDEQSVVIAPVNDNSRFSLPSLAGR